MLRSTFASRKAQLARFLAFIAAMLLVQLPANQTADAGLLGATITVNSTASHSTTHSPGASMSLMEALHLARGSLSVGALTEEECAQVSTTSWNGTSCEKNAIFVGPGASRPDTVNFNITLGGDSIVLHDSLPSLSSGDDTLDGTGSGLTINGNGHTCLAITSAGNTVKGMAFSFCSFAIAIVGGDQNTVGGSNPGEGNVLSGNSGSALIILTANANTIVGNMIGTNAAGSSAVPNGENGILMGQASGNDIRSNVISGNQGSGIAIADPAPGTTIRGNFIGTNAAGSMALPNQRGILISNTSDVFIGGQQPTDANVISGNEEEGVSIDDNSVGITISNNNIGTSTDGLDPLPNETGIRVTGGALFKIAVTGRNVIAYNSTFGVLVDGTGGGARAYIRTGSIHSNGSGGIENINGGNSELPPPIITGFGSVSGTACPFCIVDIYSDEAAQGRVYEGSVNADAAGEWTFSGNPSGPNATATNFDSQGNTSEFSAPVSVPDLPTPTPGPTASASATPLATPSPSVTPATPTPSPETGSPAASATPTPSATTGPNVDWGDANCSGDVDPVDSLLTLRFDAGLSANTGSCPALGVEVDIVAAPLHLWGDIDCSGDVSPVDSLKLLRHDAGLSVSQDDTCPTVGSAVDIAGF